jgi:hypothetical protein
MSNRNATFAKRQREQNQKERARQREQRRAERRSRIDSDPGVAVQPGEDPDIAGIVPGPQPLPYDEEL